MNYCTILTRHGLVEEELSLRVIDEVVVGLCNCRGVELRDHATHVVEQDLRQVVAADEVGLDQAEADDERSDDFAVCLGAVLEFLSAAARAEGVVELLVVVAVDFVHFRHNLIVFAHLQVRNEVLALVLKSLDVFVWDIQE